LPSHVSRILRSSPAAPNSCSSAGEYEQRPSTMRISHGSMRGQMRANANTPVCERHRAQLRPGRLHPGATALQSNSDPCTGNHHGGQRRCRAVCPGEPRHHASCTRGRNCRQGKRQYTADSTRYSTDGRGDSGHRRCARGSLRARREDSPFRHLANSYLQGVFSAPQHD
jgi:hypothetical protein